MLRNPVRRTRADILDWLKDPGRAERGVTAEAVAARFGLPRAVAATHLRVLAAAGLLRTGTAGGRPTYRRDEMRVADVARMFEKGW
ncbi:ArsR/SmtB family transcription factor [Streptomyces sp. NPDC085946]|uniref:ArsR/SmtB family transcription factor n=1 Tax=Streptomyces sp. NPDC085946 TaxID=3365744 RepID=UPI0037D79AEB